MKLFFQKTILLVAAIFVISCGSHDDSLIQLYNSIEMALHNQKDGLLKVQIPDETSGIVVFSSPYSVATNDDYLVKLTGKDITKEISNNTNDDSAFHVFLISKTKKRIVLYKKWKTPPVAFNDYIAVEFSNSDKNLVFEVSNSVLKSVEVEK